MASIDSPAQVPDLVSCRLSVCPTVPRITGALYCGSQATAPRATIYSVDWSRDIAKQEFTSARNHYHFVIRRSSFFYLRLDGVHLGGVMANFRRYNARFRSVVDLSCDIDSGRSFLVGEHRNIEWKDTGDKNVADILISLTSIN